jgi:thioredoxin 1
MKKLIKFEKDNCPACKQVEMFLMSNRTKAEIINPFENPDLAVKYEISSVPVTILLNEDGEELTRSIGFKPDELEEMIENLK